MACRITELILDCRDPETLADFWCQVLDYVVLETDEDGGIEIGPRRATTRPIPGSPSSSAPAPTPGRPSSPPLRRQRGRPRPGRGTPAPLRPRRPHGRRGPNRRGALARPGRPRRQRVLPPPQNSKTGPPPDRALKPQAGMAGCASMAGAGAPSRTGALTPSPAQAVKVWLLQLPRLCTHTFMYTFRPSLIDRSRTLYASSLVSLRVFFSSTCSRTSRTGCRRPTSWCRCRHRTSRPWPRTSPRRSCCR